MLYYLAASLIFRPIFLLIFRWKIKGREQIPLQGPVLICSNHISWWDPPLVGTASPRPVYFMAKKELFEYPIFGTILRLLHAFPVDREQADMSSLRKSLEILKAGKVVGLFPEGHRSKTGKLQKAMPGAAWIALKSRATVIPAAIQGPYRLFRPVRITFGTPVPLERYYQQKVTAKLLEEVTGDIMASIASLLTNQRVTEVKSWR